MEWSSASNFKKHWKEYWSWIWLSEFGQGPSGIICKWTGFHILAIILLKPTCRWFYNLQMGNPIIATCSYLQHSYFLMKYFSEYLRLSFFCFYLIVVCFTVPLFLFQEKYFINNISISILSFMYKNNCSSMSLTYLKLTMRNNLM